jgi:hypothetical protein
VVRVTYTTGPPLSQEELEEIERELKSMEEESGGSGEPVGVGPIKVPVAMPGQLLSQPPAVKVTAGQVMPFVKS